jgi:LCP family protein required for cell wall assembly
MLRGWRSLFAVFSVLFVAGGLYFGYVFLQNSSHVVDALGQLLFGLSGSNEGAEITPPDWEQQERVNILLLGIDRRPDEGQAPARTDTMLVASIDPFTKSAALLGIPRDLWLPIPLRDREINDRVNAANVYGDLYGYPGGGPALAKKTVEYNLGIRIHYYVLIDFEGFKDMVDTLGGIDVYLERPLVDCEYPTPDYETMCIRIDAGQQHLFGKEALWYVRSRHQDSDFGRMQRQQQTLMALRDKALQLDVIPRLPQLLGQFKETVKTDITLSEVMTLANIAKEIDANHIVGRAIDAEYVTPTVLDSGADVLLPNRDAIAGLIAEVFFDSRLEQESAVVEVLNGTTHNGLAADTAAYLESQGFKAVRYGNAGEEPEHNNTIIVDYTGKRYTVELIARLLNVPEERIQHLQDIGSPVDVRIILGDDVPEL